MCIEGQRIYLRPVLLSDASENYVAWLNDPEVNQYLESRFIKQSLQSVRDYVERITRDANTLFLAIVSKSEERHIGNVKLGPIDWNHRVGDIGIMIGDKAYWRKGFGGDAIRLLSEYAFSVLKLHKLTAGAYENNIGSIRAFLKAGYLVEGRLRDHYLYKDIYVDKVVLARFT